MNEKTFRGLASKIKKISLKAENIKREFVVVVEEKS